VTLDRRQFLRAGGASLLGLALVACTGDDKPAAGPTTTAPPDSSSSVPPSDIALVKTAASLEALAVSVYKRVSTSTVVQDPTASEAIALFQSHHAAHLTAFNALLEASEVPAITDPNAVMSGVFDPAVAAAATEEDIERLLLTLEDALSQTYVYATGVASRPEYRASLMTVTGVQARHRALLGFTFAKQRVEDLYPSAFAKDDNPLPPDALLT
jgi:hypothetical protein